MKSNPRNDFEDAVSDHARMSLVREVWEFLRVTKKWWLLPIVIVLALFSALVLMSGTAAAPLHLHSLLASGLSQPNQYRFVERGTRTSTGSA